MENFLSLFGLSRKRELLLMQERAEKSESYARALTEDVSKRGDLVVAGDYTSLNDLTIDTGRRLVVPPWVVGTRVSGVMFIGAGHHSISSPISPDCDAQIVGQS